MAQNYEIDIKRFNGQDYDTLLPTPADHASTHQANGSDPITVTNTMLGNNAVTTGKITNASVTRAKLARDALYSPIAGTPISNMTRAITVADVGKTLLFLWTSGEGSMDSEFTLSLTDSLAIPAGAEIALYFMHGRSCQIEFSGGIFVDIAGEGRAQNRTLKIPEKYGMVALKKILHASDTNADYWLVTGNVEVV